MQTYGCPLLHRAFLATKHLVASCGLHLVVFFCSVLQIGYSTDLDSSVAY